MPLPRMRVCPTVVDRRSRSLRPLLARVEGLEDRRLLSVVTWDRGANTDNWTDAANWSGDALPGAGDDAVIPADTAGAVVVLNATVAVNSVTAAKPLQVDSGQLSIAAASSIDSFTLTGGSLTGSGVVTINDAASWTGGSMTGLGETVVGADATMTISGATAKSLAARTLTNEGTVTWTGGQLSLGNGSVLENQGLFDAQADLTLAQGAGAQANFNNAGTLRKSAGTGLQSIGVRLTNTGTIEAQSGTLNLSSNATSFTNFSAGTLTGGTYVVTATLRFFGAAILNNAASIVLSGAGSSIINQGGADAIQGFSSNGAAGSFTVQGGRQFASSGAFANAGSVTVGAGGSRFSTGSGDYAQTGGSTAVLAGGTLDPAGIADIQGGTLSGGGTIQGNVTNAGTVAPGSSPGRLSIQGSYTQTAAGALAIELTGTTPESGHDVLAITNLATLAGTLAVTTPGGFVSVPGDTFTVLTFGSRSGDFTTRTGLDFPGRRFLTSTYNPSGLTLRTFQADAKVTPTSGLQTTEAGGTAQFTVALTAPPAQSITISLSSSDATEGTVSPSSLTFTPANWNVAQAVTVTGADDADDDGDVAYALLTAAIVSGDVHYDGLDPADVSAVNLDDDDAPALPSLSIGNATVTELDSGTVAATFSVTLSAPSAQAVTVHYQTADGTAKAGSDYNAKAGTLTFDPGETTASAVVTVRSDLTDENAEAFTVVLDTPVGATIDDGTGTGTIQDNDPPPSVSAADAPAVVEGLPGGAKSAVFAVTLSAASGKTVTVQYQANSGTATVGTDFAVTSGTLTFLAGETKKTVSVPIVSDSAIEPDESLTLDLSAPSNVTIADGSAAGTILNDDVLIRAKAISAVEGDAGSTVATWDVYLEGDGPGRTFPVSVQYLTTDGPSALTGATEADGDYTGTGPIQTLNFPVGTSSLPVSVTVHGDDEIEPSEGVALRFSNSVNAAIKSKSVKLTIINDETTATIAPSATPLVEAPGGTFASFTVTLTTLLPVDAKVNFATKNGTAVADKLDDFGNVVTPGDYAPTRNFIIIPAGTLTGTILIPVHDDLLDEASETFQVVLSRPVHFVLTAGQEAASATIADDDPMPTVSVANASVPEGGLDTTAPAAFVVTLSVPSGRAVTVQYATANGTALTSDGDYSAKTGTVTFRAGQTSATINVTVRGDAKVEATEQFALNLTSPTNATILDGAAVGTIVNDDGALRLSGRAFPNRHRPALRDEALRPIVDEAIRRLAIGISDAEAEWLRAVRVVVADLDGDRLGSSDGSTLTIDADAAGRGWFVDATPEDDAEFRGPGEADRGRARWGSGARPRVDLLSVVMHELGHALGRDHAEDEADAMHESLGVGRRTGLLQAAPSGVGPALTLWAKAAGRKRPRP